VAEIEAGRRERVLHVGNLDVERDLTDVRDMVRGYHLAAVHGRSGQAYNLGSGTARSIRAVLDWFVAAAGVTIDVLPDPARQRPVDVARTLCDAGKAGADLGWSPTIEFEQTLADILDYWRARVAAEGC
jgi:GDP-4-dehydro-6-deoxy-D-mannose reductase